MRNSCSRSLTGGSLSDAWAAPAHAERLGSPYNLCEVTPDLLWPAKPAQDGAGVARSTRVGRRDLDCCTTITRLGEPGPRAHAGTNSLFRYPVGSRTRSSLRSLDDHVAHFLAVVDKQPKPVYVHCRSGQNRTA